MREIRVKVIRSGREIAIISRPVRTLNGKPAVTYKKKLWPLVNRCEIHLDKSSGPALHAPDVTKEDESANRDGIKIDATEGTEFPELMPDPAQEIVIRTPSQERLIVNAGPGTGKTAVACARVAWLIDQESLDPGHIWLISFTRAAVREIRERIGSYLRDAGSAYSVRIATLDSHAWAIHSGFDENARVKISSYDENIERLISLIGSHEDITEYFGALQHLVVDEAQDIVGIRADLVSEIIRRLNGNCGVTIFFDEAQAIYGFSDQGDTEAVTGTRRPGLPVRLRDNPTSRFREIHLNTVHRTHSPRLKQIFTDTRRRILLPNPDSRGKLREIKNEVSEWSDGRVRDITQLSPDFPSDAFILYRRRVEVLLASSFLTTRPHRIRMSGLPTCLAPWIGACLGEHTSRDLPKSLFLDLWSQHIEGTQIAAIDGDKAWLKLVRFAGRTEKIIDMVRLRQCLGRGQPPAEFCTPDLGTGGPIIGTIHACKGREADVVHLMMPGDPGDRADHEEESRVVFVGATRARRQLKVGDGYRQNVSYINGSRRPYALIAPRRVQVEIGRNGDILSAGLAGRSFFPTSADVAEAQKRMLSFSGRIVPVSAFSNPSLDFSYLVADPVTKRELVVLSKKVNSELFSIAERIGGNKYRPSDILEHLRIFGIRTLVVPPDSPDLATLHEPWASSGIMLAPLLHGYTTTFFPFRTRRY